MEHKSSEEKWCFQEHEYLPHEYPMDLGLVLKERKGCFIMFTDTFSFLHFVQNFHREGNGGSSF